LIQTVGKEDFMTAIRGPTLRIRAKGPLACFTRPELKVERVTYPVITPSAARGLIEAILWKPAIRWYIDRIHVLAPIKYTAFRRNEVNTKAAAPKTSVVKNGGEVKQYFAEEDRAQRNTIALRDVDYVIETHFTMTDKAQAEDNINKFVDMFDRRVRKGQHFHQPYFGCREFVADVSPPEESWNPIPETLDLGQMLWDIEFGTDRNRPLFFPARLEGGILHVPDTPAFAQGGTP
jgi:CRISPR-associated protein Cas5d